MPVSSRTEQPWYTGEWWDSYIKLLYLRARWLMPESVTFLSKDVWEGDNLRPRTFNGWSYVEGNPVNWIDPTGYQTSCNEDGYCPEIDRYLCGSNTPGGYDYRGKPCITNPQNVQVGNPPIPSTAPLAKPPLISPTSPEDIIWLSHRDERDLTPWLFAELKAGIYNRDIGLIRLELMIPTPNNIALAGIQWRQLVRDRARYDFKHRILFELRETILFRTENGLPLWSEYSVPGNIFYGYVGRSAGFPGWTLHTGAGYAEAVDPAHEEIRNICDVAYLPPERIPTLGDDPIDYRGVQFGIDLWNKYGASLSLPQFRRELEQNYDKFAPPPALPGYSGIPDYPWKNPRGGWPYAIGRFNGPDEHRHWPPRLENGLGFYEF